MTAQRQRKYPPASRFEFRAGPYTPPTAAIGSTVHDQFYGDVTVEGMTRSPIRWPGFHCRRGRHKGLMPILFAGLVRAVVEEDEVAVAHYWGVTRYMVNEWKQAIAGCEDSNTVFTALAVKRASPAFRKKFGYA
jgi:hypothetical protein